MLIASWYVRGSKDGSAIAAVIHAACQATVPSVRSFGRKTPLRLRVCGCRAAGAVEVEGAADEGLGDVDGDGPVGERLGDTELGDALGDTLGDGEAEPEDRKSVV